MKKTEALRRQVLLMLCVFCGLGTYIADSYFGVRVSASGTLARLPASIGIRSENEAAQSAKQVTTLSVSCAELSADYKKAIPTKWLQLQFEVCGDQTKPQVQNLTNGFEASLFRAPAGYLSDLITLAKGENQISIRKPGQEESLQILITFQ